MKHLFVTIVLLSSMLSAGAQPLGELEPYLNSSKVSAFAKQYYNDEIKTAANDTTKRIIDSLKTKNNFTRPFYLLQVSKMLMYTDAELAQVLMKECYNFLDKRPDELVEFLYCDSKYVLSDYKNYWATSISFHVRKTANSDPKDFLSEMQEKLAKKCAFKNMANLDAFFELIVKRF